MYLDLGDFTMNYTPKRSYMPKSKSDIHPTPDIIPVIQEEVTEEQL